MSETNPTINDPWSNTAPSVAPATSIDSDPWGAPASATNSDASDAWGSSTAVTDPDAAASSTDWLQNPAATSSSSAQDATQQWWEHLTTGTLPIQDWVNSGLTWVVDNFRPFFQAVRTPIDTTLTGVTDLLLSVPWPVLIGFIALFAWQFSGLRLAIGSALALALVALCGIWPEAMVTLALVLTSLLFCVLIGLPMGIWLASSERAQRWMRPLLDAMQTTPAFVYLVPVVMLFGIGNVPGVIVTIVFALPPLIRLTNLGLRQVRPDLIEASRAYGASPWQLLWKVQLPLAMPSIMTGINQALMLSLSMVVIASMIAVGGLGQMVLRGIGRLDMGLATVGGLGIVLLAIVLDRITQSMGKKERGHTPWWQTGPIGLLMRQRRAPAASHAPATPAYPPKPVKASTPASTDARPLPSTGIGVS